jgi:hypothetical protein
MRTQRMRRRRFYRRRWPGRVGFLSHGSPAAIIGSGHFQIDAMRNFLKSCARALGTCLDVTVSVVGIMMLLSFPANPSHHFDAHFRSNEARRSIVRHAFVAGPEADAVRTVARIDVKHAIPTPVIAESATKPLTTCDFCSDVSLIRLLQRYKLGPSRSSGPDPLL